MVDKERSKAEKRLSYRLEQWKKIDSITILSNISDNVELVQFMESLGNMNHSLSVSARWIFDTNYQNIYYCQLNH